MTESAKFKIFEELLKYPDEVITLAVLYARHFVMYGADVTEKWQTAVEQATALGQAYNQGIADEIKRQLMIKPQLAQPKGKWTKVKPISEDMEAYMCPFCKTGDWDISVDSYNYCPYCGKPVSGVLDDPSHPFADDVMMKGENDG